MLDVISIVEKRRVVENSVIALRSMRVLEVPVNVAKRQSDGIPRQIHAQKIPNLQIAQTSYGRATATDFVIINMHDGEQTRFSMTYGTQGRFEEVPLIVTYQPRWWMQVELTIDDAARP